MTKTPAQQWDAMTDEEKVSFLATKVMGWEVIKGAYYYYVDPNGEETQTVDEWNPLTDHNHWREVEEKIMEDRKLLSAFLGKIETWSKDEMHSYLNADLPTRCKAAFLALQ